MTLPQRYGFVFTTSDGTPHESTNVTKRLQRLMRAAGLEPIRWHDLRHGAATLLIAQGVHPRVIMERLGHSDIAVTMNVYGHVTASLDRDAANRMDAALGG